MDLGSTKQLKTELLKLSWWYLERGSSKKINKKSRDFSWQLKEWTLQTWQFNRGRKEASSSRKRKLFTSPVNVRSCNFQWALCLNRIIEGASQAWEAEAGMRRCRLQLREGCYSCSIKSPCTNQYYWLGRTPRRGIKQSVWSAGPDDDGFEENRTLALREKCAFTSPWLSAFHW